MELLFNVGKVQDIDELEQLYNSINDYLESNINYPGWRKGAYPVKENAVEGVKQGTLYTAKWNGQIVGSVILSHEPEEAYKKAEWLIESDYKDIIVIHTFVVHPDYLKAGIGKAIMDFAENHGKSLNAKSIRLDVYEGNSPAIHLYEKCGYTYIDTVDLGLGDYGLHWFRLYEKLI